MSADDLLQERAVLGVTLYEKMRVYYEEKRAGSNISPLLQEITDLERRLFLITRDIAHLEEDENEGSPWHKLARNVLLNTSRWHVREGHYITVPWQWTTQWTAA